MNSKIGRRSFLKLSSLVCGASLLSQQSIAALLHDLAAGTGIRLGYASITWHEDHMQFLKDVTALGYKWIQLRNYLLKQYGKNPEALVALMQQYNTKLAMYSLGDANISTGDDRAVLAPLMEQARFVKALGGTHVMVTNNSRPKTGAPSKEQLVTYAKLITELGKQTADIGVVLTYHNHMGQLGQTPEEVDVIFDHTDPRYVKALLDIGHYAAGGGDPVQFVYKYKTRLECLHIKDVLRPAPDQPHNKDAYKFVELGKGHVNIHGVFNALRKVNFNGWALVELDYVPDPSVTPTQTALTNHQYLTKNLKLKV